MVFKRNFDVYQISYVTTKVNMHESCGEVSLVEQDTIDYIPTAYDFGNNTLMTSRIVISKFV